MNQKPKVPQITGKQQGNLNNLYHPVAQYLSLYHKRLSLPVLLNVFNQLNELPVAQQQQIAHEEILKMLKQTLQQVIPIQYNQNHEEALEVYGTLLVETIFSPIFTFQNSQPSTGSANEAETVKSEPKLPKQFFQFKKELLGDELLYVQAMIAAIKSHHKTNGRHPAIEDFEYQWSIYQLTVSRSNNRANTNAAANTTNHHQPQAQSQAQDERSNYHQNRLRLGPAGENNDYTDYYNPHSNNTSNHSSYNQYDQQPYYSNANNNPNYHNYQHGSSRSYAPQSSYNNNQPYHNDNYTPSYNNRYNNTNNQYQQGGQYNNYQGNRPPPYYKAGGGRNPPPYYNNRRSQPPPYPSNDYYQQQQQPYEPSYAAPVPPPAPVVPSAPVVTSTITTAPHEGLTDFLTIMRKYNMDMVFPQATHDKILACLFVALKTFQQPVLHRQVIALTLAIKDSGFFNNVEQGTKAKARGLLAILKQSNIVLKCGHPGEAVQLYVDESIGDFDMLRDRHDSFLTTFLAEQYISVPEKLRGEIVWQIDEQLRESRAHAIKMALKSLESIGKEILLNHPTIGIDGLDEQSSRNMYENEYYNDDYPSTHTPTSPHASSNPSISSYDALYYPSYATSHPTTSAAYPNEAYYDSMDSNHSLKRSPLAASNGATRPAAINTAAHAERSSLSTHYYGSDATTSSSLLTSNDARSPHAWSLPAQRTVLPPVTSSLTMNGAKELGNSRSSGAESMVETDAAAAVVATAIRGIVGDDETEETENMEFRQPLYSDEDAPNVVDFSDLRSTIINTNTVEDDWFDFQSTTAASSTAAAAATAKTTGISKVLQYMNTFDNSGWKSSPSLSLQPHGISSTSASLMEEPFEWKESRVSSNASTVDNTLLPPPGLYTTMHATTTASLFSHPDPSLLSFMSTTSAMTMTSKGTIATNTTCESVDSYPSFSTIGSKNTNHGRYQPSHPPHSWKVSPSAVSTNQKKQEAAEERIEVGEGEDDRSESEADEEYAADRQSLLYFHTADMLDSIIDGSHH